MGVGNACGAMNRERDGEVLARGGRSIFARVRWGGGGEGRAFHIYSSKIGEVLARGGWPSGLCCLPECDDCCLSV